MADDAERDRRSGLARVLEAIAELGTGLDQTRAEIAGLHGRLDALEQSTGDPVRVVVDPTEIRRAVAMAIDELDIPSTADQVQAVLTTALSVLPAPVVDGEAVQQSVQAALGAELQGLSDRLVERLTEVLSVEPIEPDAVASAIGRRLADDVALATGGAVGNQEVVADLVRRTVAASHRALVAQLTAVLERLRQELAGDQAELVKEVGLDVEAIRRAIERAGGVTR